MKKMMIKMILLLSIAVCFASFKHQKSEFNMVAENTKSKSELNIKIKIGDKTFNATLLDNATSKAFVAQLPLTINMIELNNNEKYAQLPKSVPTNASIPARIEAGDLMMYGSSTLVLFYKGFSTSYSYTKIGKIDDVSELVPILGKGNIPIHFQL